MKHTDGPPPANICNICCISCCCEGLGPDAEEGGFSGGTLLPADGGTVRPRWDKLKGEKYVKIKDNSDYSLASCKF